MKRLMLSAVVSAALIAAGSLATGASATSHRHDAYYQVWCITPDGGDPVQAESVDAHSIQLAKDPGGKDGAVRNFIENHPGWDCWLVGPLSAQTANPHLAIGGGSTPPSVSEREW